MLDPQVAESLRQGILAAKAGNAGQAERYLRQVIAADRNNEAAWLWLSSVVESPSDVVLCLENVLVINPSNEEARMALGWARKAAGVAEFEAPAPVAPPAIPAPTPSPARVVPPSPAGSGVRAGPAQTPPAPAPVPPTADTSASQVARWSARAPTRSEPDPSATPVPKLGEYLVRYGFISQSQLDAALRNQSQQQSQGRPIKLGEVLLEMKFLSSQRLEYAVRQQQRDFYSTFND